MTPRLSQRCAPRPWPSSGDRDEQHQAADVEPRRPVAQRRAAARARSAASARPPSTKRSACASTMPRSRSLALYSVDESDRHQREQAEQRHVEARLRIRAAVAHAARSGRRHQRFHQRVHGGAALARGCRAAPRRRSLQPRRRGSCARSAPRRARRCGPASSATTTAMRASSAGVNASNSTWWRSIGAVDDARPFLVVREKRSAVPVLPAI